MVKYYKIINNKLDSKEKQKQKSNDPIKNEHKTLEQRIKESKKELKGLGEIEWGEPQGNEVW